MAEYKKKRVERFKRPPRPKIRKKHPEKEPSQDIPMSDGSEKVKSKKDNAQKMRVVKGKKPERRRRMRLFALIAGVLIAAIAVAEWALPCGILENLGNAIALIGPGGYPIELDSNDTINAVSRGSYYYLLTNNELAAYSNAGKKVYGIAHGFETPVFKTSATRAMLFSQNGNEVLIHTLSGRVAALSVDDGILTGDISDSGVFAVVTRSPGYASTVRVYDKKAKQLYEWNSAQDVINCVAVSPNGKKIAVAGFKTSGGVYQATVRVLNYKSATPEFEKTIEGDFVRELSAFGKGFFAVGKNRVDFYEWKNGKATEYENDYDLAYFKAGKNEAAAVFTRVSDRSDTRMVIFSKKGDKKAEFSFKGTVSDIQVANGHIYCIGDNKILLLDENGNVIRQAECSFGARKIVPAGSNYAVVFSDREVERIKLGQK